MKPTTLLIATVAFVAVLGGEAFYVVKLLHDLDVAKLAPAKIATIQAAARVDTVKVELAAKRDTVLKVLKAWKTDTLMLHPVTPEDTAKAVAQLPQIVAKGDLMEKSCSAFVISCDKFREAAINKFQKDSTYILSLEQLGHPRCGMKCGILLGVGAIYILNHHDQITSAIRP